MAGSFSLDLTRFAKRSKQDLQTIIHKITMEAFKRIILRTPVDTGRARANWSVTEGEPGKVYHIESIDKDGNATISTATKTVDGWNCTGSIFLTNNLPYIIKLEFGHSSQAPSGMVRLTVAEMQAWAQNSSNIKGGI